MFFLHMIGTLALGFYLVLPFLVGKIGSLSPAAQEGMVSAVQLLNRIAQFALIILLVSGIFLTIGGPYSVKWIVIVFVLFLAISAIGGIMGKPLRLALEALRNNQPINGYIGKMRTFSTLLAVFLILITFLMVYSHII
ncbi:hypothetical protein [Paenibacillus brasilensis]|uniref:Copper resistance protein D domain-containing protein n=1 Tax=Paenibacillus brasilensis TaxID=128574 RepID=A0ABU0L060_9BACL|nr:hypothetical protein [Paenibacillus brasilensis]MDQ0493602.1 hypothetical protein [Paenibacillus brasilensis]